MKYALLMYLGEGISEQLSQSEKQQRTMQHRELQRQAAAAGHYAGSTQLAPVATAVRVVTHGEEQVTSDGPFPETKEHLVGFYVIDCEALDQAIAYARRIPLCPRGTVEIRPILWEGTATDLRTDLLEACGG